MAKALNFATARAVPQSSDSKAVTLFIPALIPPIAVKDPIPSEMSEKKQGGLTVAFAGFEKNQV